MTQVSPPRPDCAAIVLAAGASSRLGQPKQLLLYQGETLVRRAARLALAANASPVFVVVPAHPTTAKETIDVAIRTALSQAHIQALDGLAVTILANTEAHTGMGSSLRLGMAALIAVDPLPSRVLLLVCDQPLLRLEDIRKLLEAQASAPAGIAAASFIPRESPSGEQKSRLGVPAVFSTTHFQALSVAAGDQGARSLLRTHRVTPVPIPEAAIDIDVPDDLRRLRGSSG